MILLPSSDDPGRAHTTTGIFFILAADVCRGIHGAVTDNHAELPDKFADFY
jgi:hypothetical protein